MYSKLLLILAASLLVLIVSIFFYFPSKKKTIIDTTLEVNLNSGSKVCVKDEDCFTVNGINAGCYSKEPVSLDSTGTFTAGPMDCICMEKSCVSVDQIITKASKDTVVDLCLRINDGENDLFQQNKCLRRAAGVTGDKDICNLISWEDLKVTCLSD